MRKKLNKAQENALRLIGILRTKNYKPGMYLIVGIFIFLFILLVRTIFYQRTNQNQKVVRQCHETNLKATFNKMLKEDHNNDLKNEISSCKNKLANYSPYPFEMACEEIRKLASGKEKISVGLDQREKRLLDLCK